MTCAARRLYRVFETFDCLSAPYTSPERLAFTLGMQDWRANKDNCVSCNLFQDRGVARAGLSHTGGVTAFATRRHYAPLSRLVGSNPGILMDVERAKPVQKSIESILLSFPRVWNVLAKTCNRLSSLPLERHVPRA